MRHPFRAVKNGIRVVRFALLDLDAERDKLFEFLTAKFGADMSAIRNEFEHSEFYEWTRDRREALANYNGPYRFGSTGQWDCEALYYLIRAMQPQTVVETGVCYGASSSYILEALERNGHGQLFSIDLGNPPEEPPNDFFVHPDHRARWQLIIGDVRDEMPPLLNRLRQIDLFHHDSLHTYDHMMWEYETALPYLNPAGAISSDDVGMILSLAQPLRNNPFSDFCVRHEWASHTASNFGVAVNDSPLAAQARRQRSADPSQDLNRPVAAKLRAAR
jgi:predicted O-methyltransferase YrrM